MSVHTQRSCIPVTDTSRIFALCYLLCLQSAKYMMLHKYRMELMIHLHIAKFYSSQAWMATRCKLNYLVSTRNIWQPHKFLNLYMNI